MAEGEYSTLRNLLLVVVALLVLGVGADVYLGRVIAENSVVFEKIYTLLESGVSEQFTGAMTQASAIEKKLAETNAHAAEMDARMKKVFKEAEDSMMQRLNAELPIIMDRYLEARSAKFRQGLAQDETMRQQLRQEVGEVVREEMRRARPQP